MFIRIEIVKGEEKVEQRIDLDEFFEQFSLYTIYLMILGFFSQFKKGVKPESQIL